MVYSADERCFVENGIYFSHEKFKEPDKNELQSPTF